MKPFVFRGKETSYDYAWNVDNSFVFDFGDGDKDFIDNEGDSYFIHCEYESDNPDTQFWFEQWWEDESTEADFEIVTEEEREYIKQFMMELMEGK